MRLNIIGCGRLGRTLARLFTRHNVFTIDQVMTQRRKSAEAAVELIGAGKAINDWPGFSSADAWLIATPDQQIEHITNKLLECNLIRKRSIVFHCSGAIPAEVLGVLRTKGAHIASVHPVKSFAEFKASVDSFAGTWCGVEGDEEALEVLCPVFEKIGGRCFAIESQQKSHYHIASIMVCNYLTALMEVGLREFELAGISRLQALEITEPIMRGTLDNIKRMGTSQALTGPIVRTDFDVIEKQLAVLQDGDQRIMQLYRLLGSIACDLVSERANHPGPDNENNIDLQHLERIKNLFNQETTNRKICP